MKHKILFLSALTLVSLTHARAADAASSYCREYTQSVGVGGRAESAYGTACRQPDGSWQIVSMRGREDLFDDVERRIRDEHPRVIVVNDYAYPRHAYPRYAYRPVYYPRYYSPQPLFSFSFSNWDRDRDWDRRHGWDDHHRRDRDHDRDGRRRGRNRR